MRGRTDRMLRGAAQHLASPLSIDPRENNDEFQRLPESTKRHLRAAWHKQDQEAASWTDERRIGFGAEVRSASEVRPSEILSEVLPEDLLAYGLIPEFIGRLPVIATVDDLDVADLVRVLTEPKNSLVKQYAKFFEMDGVELIVNEEALLAIAQQAMGRGTGARGLRAIMEEVLLDTMYELPSRSDIARVVIDEQVVRDRVNPTLVPISDLSSADLPEERSA